MSPLKLEPSVRAGGGEEGEASIPKTWLKIKLLGLEWQFSSSCLALFTFPRDVETRTGPVSLCAALAGGHVRGFSSLAGLGWVHPEGSFLSAADLMLSLQRYCL